MVPKKIYKLMTHFIFVLNCIYEFWFPVKHAKTISESKVWILKDLFPSRCDRSRLVRLVGQGLKWKKENVNFEVKTKYVITSLLIFSFIVKNDPLFEQQTS